MSSTRTGTRRTGTTGIADRAPFGRTPEPPSEADARRVVRVIAAHARDADDCALLLDALDLNPRLGLTPREEQP
ncbi:MAG: hypothetical protein GEU83_11980 [Pseudonocardiaceae bacterium]|nr:hypothetical protein [Pseudonocardiaceae bacterium]